MSYAASCKLGILCRRLIICGLPYGGLVYVFMNFVVLPLSGVAHARGPISIASRINGVLAVVLPHRFNDLVPCAPEFSAGTERCGRLSPV
jgi:hypothetical protein